MRHTQTTAMMVMLIIAATVVNISLASSKSSKQSAQVLDASTGAASGKLSRTQAMIDELLREKSTPSFEDDDGMTYVMPTPVVSIESLSDEELQQHREMGVLLLEESSVPKPPSNGTASAKKGSCKVGTVCPFPNGDCCAPAGDFCCEHKCVYVNNLGLSYCAQKSDDNLMNEEALKLEHAESRQRAREVNAKKLAAEINTKDDQEEYQKKSMSEAEEFNKKLNTKREEGSKRHKAKVISHKRQIEMATKREEYTKTSPNRLELDNNFHPYGGKYRSPQYIRTGDLCVVSGLLKGPNTTLQFTMLPPECRPSGRLVYDVAITGVQTARYDVLSTGRILWMGGAYRAGGNNAHWISLDGFTFPVTGAPQEPLPLEDPWVDYGRGYQGARIYGKDKLCVVSGVIRTTRWRASDIKNPLAILPPQCRPNKRVFFHLNHHDESLRVDVLKNGSVMITAGKTQRSWVSLTGLVFTPHEGQALQLINGWQAYQHGYRNPSVARIKNFCVLSGLAKATQGWRSHICDLPKECQPTKRLVFTVNHHTANMRIDVLPNGELQYVAGTRTHDWVSLDGIFYTVP